MIKNMSTLLRQESHLAPARGKTTLPHVFWKDVQQKHGRLMALRLATLWRQEQKRTGKRTGVFIPKDDRHGYEGIVYTRYKALVLEDRNRRARLRLKDTEE